MNKQELDIIKHKAALWDALTQKSHIRILGYAKLKPEDEYVTQAHLGLEIWTSHPPGYGPEGGELLTRLVEKQLRVIEQQKTMKVVFKTSTADFSKVKSFTTEGDEIRFNTAISDIQGEVTEAKIIEYIKAFGIAVDVTVTYQYK